MKTHIILISGKMGTGKDFMATHMKQYLEENQGKKSRYLSFWRPFEVSSHTALWVDRKERGRS